MVSGINANSDRSINDYRDIAFYDPKKTDQQINKEYAKKLSETYGQTFSQAEAKSFGAFARDNDRAGFQKDMSMKRSDGIREQGHWTHGKGLHSGYGFGMGGSFKAGVSDNLKSLAFDTHRVAGEGIMNSMGALTDQQKRAFANSGFMGKAMIASNPLISGAVIGTSMMDLQSPGEIMAEQIAQGVGYAGFVGGARLGAAVHGALHGGTTPSSVASYVGRGSAMLTGGAVVGALAYGAVQGITAGIKDITDAESVIGSTLYKAASRDYYGDTSQTRATLTARQKALQQVNSSVFNDRGFTLGNEASILANVTL